MTPNIVCPTCHLTVRAGGSGSSHHSSAGPVRYVRCPCGQWLVLLAGDLVGVAGRSACDAVRART